MDNLYSGVDSDSLALIFQLQREDLQALRNDNTDDEASDIDLALQSQLQELSLVETYNMDSRIARSHARAVVADRDALREETRSEEQAVRDRELAVQLDQNPESNVVLAIEAASNSDDEGMARQEARIWAATSRNDTTHAADGTGLEVSIIGEPAEDEKFADCCACTEEKAWFDIFKASCGHSYCLDCVADLFELAMTDETLYPPRCCREVIPLDIVEKILNPKLIEPFKEKRIELESHDRTYCFVPTCSKFIAPGFINDDNGTCPDCGRRTCVTCKSAAHTGDCPEDDTLQEFLQTAENEG